MLLCAIGGGESTKSHSYILSTKRIPTRRAVIWLGQTCNLSCYFCYFASRIADKTHPEHPFFTLDKAKEMCRIFVDEYGCNSIDIQGGEPTIYPHIFDLIRYCNEINLKPTLITNLVALSNFDYAKKFKDVGIYDFLVSLHGIGENYDKIVGKKGAFNRQMKALENLKTLQIPIRINAVLSNEVIQDLEALTDIAIDSVARVVNFLGYNNSGDQKKLRDAHKIPYYDIIGQKLMPCIDRLENNGIEVNLRFLPFCVVEEPYRKNIYNGLQGYYDIHEWEPSLRLWTDRPSQRQAKAGIEPRSTRYYITRMKLGRAFRLKSFMWLKRAILPFLKPAPKYAPIQSYQDKILKKLRFYTPISEPISQLSKVDNFYKEMHEVFRDISREKIHTKKCQECSIKAICDGFHCDFIEEFGISSVKPIKLDTEIKDPRFYLNRQLKVIESQEWEWYFTPQERTQITSQ